MNLLVSQQTFKLTSNFKAPRERVFFKSCG